MQNGTIYLKSKKSKYLISLASSIIFTILSIKLLTISGSLLTFIPIALFLLSAAASAIPLLPNQSYLQIEKAGITVRSMFNTINLKWHEIEGFYPQKKNNKDLVAFRLSERKKTYMSLENVLGIKEVLPDNYGMEASELADLLEYHRIRAACE